ncbi:MAG: hypothetical protein PHO63_01290 [Bacilli bacterium]|nr:hypothetical protein [Bacilli bacterium]MDD4809321.1 hypothetical protein [Bacilli bacterium]
MQTIDVFNNSAIILKRKRPSYLVAYMVILIIFISSLVLISLFYNYHRYLHYSGRLVIIDSKYYLEMFIKEDDIPFLNNHILMIDQKEVEYQIIKISDIYNIDEKYQKYYEVNIQTKLNGKQIINNNIINLSFKLPPTTLFKELKKTIKKGLM